MICCKSGIMVKLDENDASLDKYVPVVLYMYI